jgi:hypothetical protein
MMITGTVLYKTELAFLLSPLTALRALLASASRAPCVYVCGIAWWYILYRRYRVTDVDFRSHYYYYLILLDRIKNIQSRKVLLKPPLDVGLGVEKIEYGC